MQSGGKKIIRTQKTKFKKNKDYDPQQNERQKHHAKTYYRLLKQEREHVL